MNQRKNKLSVMLLSFALALFMVAPVMPANTSVSEAANPTLNKKSVTLKVGQSTKLKVKNAGGKVKWSSKDKEIASVTNKGKVTGKKPGKTTIVAKTAGKTLKCTVTVKKKTAEDSGKPKLNYTQIQIYEISYLDRYLKVSNAKSEVEWTTSNSSICDVTGWGDLDEEATLLSGNLDRLKEEGLSDKAVITAKVDGYTLKCTVTVLPMLEFTEPYVFILKGNTKTLPITNDFGAPIKWESEDPSIATVKNGKVTGVSKGDTVIKATVDAFGGSDAEIEVWVREAEK